MCHGVTKSGMARYSVDGDGHCFYAKNLCHAAADKHSQQSNTELNEPLKAGGTENGLNETESPISDGEGGGGGGGGGRIGHCAQQPLLL